MNSAEEIYKSQYREKQLMVEQRLEQLIQSRMDCPPELLAAIRYSLMAGGKRLRPVLLMSANELAGGDSAEDCLDMACAVEMIHTYSLIHDDLPAMDDDDYRRGQPTSHKVFGEAAAILAGDGLLNLAYEIMLESVPPDNYRAVRYLEAMKAIASAAGISGMVGGQAVDTAHSDTDTEHILSYIHTHKTGALITASLKAGVLIETQDKNIIGRITAYGNAIGMAFQITDDILDKTGELSSLGKTPGSDERKGKLTFPSRFGLEESMKMAQQYIDTAISSLSPFGGKAEFLRQLAFHIPNRSK